jgi:Rrf2 family transcriptional regulator, iron-sulfur cluster assembly transcription factor
MPLDSPGAFLYAPISKEIVMRMSTKGRFAINALIDLALREAAGPVALATISARQQVSLSYLEQMFSRLRRVGVVESTRGPGGGYTLGRPAAQITVADIVSAVDDPLEGGSAEGAAEGLSQALWQRLNAAMLEHMATITLQSLVDEQKALGAQVEARPVRRAVAPAPVVRPPRTTAPNSVFAFGRSFAK